MCTIYILSGKVFGTDIYEIACTTNINNRFFSEITGYPDSNILHFSSNVKYSDIKTCQNMITNTLNTYRMNTGSNFYKIDINKAIEQTKQIVFNINLSYENEIKEKEKENQNNLKKQSCF